jgi:hypothetical protein
MIEHGTACLPKPQPLDQLRRLATGQTVGQERRPLSPLLGHPGKAGELPDRADVLELAGKPRGDF